MCVIYINIIRRLNVKNRRGKPMRRGYGFFPLSSTGGGRRVMMTCARNDEAMRLISFYDEAYNNIILYLIPRVRIFFFFLPDYRPINYYIAFF